MDFMKLIGTVLAVCYNSGYALKGFASQRICRRGTEKPCYKIVYQQDGRLRVGFDVARQACKDDNGELLSIETENEQRLVEKFVQDLRAADGDFWIGLRRAEASTDSDAGDCSSLYHWLDHSQAVYRNWLFNEPSCGVEICGALYHRAPRRASLQSHYMFKWTDANCNAKNNFICKYSAEKSPVGTPAGNPSTRLDIPKVTVKPKQPPVTLSYEEIKNGVSESSDDGASVYYILMGGVPVLLLAALLVSGFLCYRLLIRKRKEPNHIYAEPGNWVCAGALQNHSARPGQRTAHLEYMSSEINGNISATGPGCLGEYENLPSGTAGFVTNDIYETCRSPAASEAGWVDNDIYGY